VYYSRKCFRKLQDGDIHGYGMQGEVKAAAGNDAGKVLVLFKGNTKTHHCRISSVSRSPFPDDVDIFGELSLGFLGGCEELAGGYHIGDTVYNSSKSSRKLEDGDTCGYGLQGEVKAPGNVADEVRVLFVGSKQAIRCSINDLSRSPIVIDEGATFPLLDVDLTQLILTAAFKTNSDSHIDAKFLHQAHQLRRVNKAWKKWLADPLLALRCCQECGEALPMPRGKEGCRCNTTMGKCYERGNCCDHSWKWVRGHQGCSSLSMLCIDCCEAWCKECELCSVVVMEDEAQGCVCGLVACNECDLTGCEDCGEMVCENCLEACTVCQKTSCQQCSELSSCANCNNELSCPNCTYHCAGCNDPFDRHCWDYGDGTNCFGCEEWFCGQCDTVSCDICEERHCETCADDFLVCSECEKKGCEECAWHQWDCANCHDARICEECAWHCNRCNKVLCKMCHEDDTCCTESLQVGDQEDEEVGVSDSDGS